MALIEVEFTEELLTELIYLLLSAAPVPIPTLDVLGPDRLIASFLWSNVLVGPAPPGLTPPPGTLPVKADLNIGHVSLAELDVDPHAETQSPSTAWLLLTASAGRLEVDAMEIDVVGKPQRMFAPPLRVGLRKFDPTAGAAATSVAASAIVRGGDTVTIRFATDAADALFLPSADRTKDIGGDWAIRVSGEIFAERVRDQLNAGLTPPPPDLNIEDAPSAAWLPLTNGLGPWHAGLSDWGVVGSVGLEKPDACPGISIGPVDTSVDMSVTVNTVLTMAADATTTDLNKKLKLQLRVTSDASDWDSFRCWAGTGGIAALVLGAISSPIVGGLVAIGSLLDVAEVVRHETWTAVSTHVNAGEFRRVGGDSSSATYEGTLSLPRLSDNIHSIQVGADGLVVTGFLQAVSATHKVVFQPEGGTISGSWRGSYSCSSHEWVQTYDGPVVGISDDAFIGALHFASVPVTVWPTSAAVPPNEWVVEFPQLPLPSQSAAVNPRDSSAPGGPGRAYIHTSAGIRVYDIAAAAAKPPPPDDVALAAHDLNCRKFMRESDRLTEMHWLIDPPEFDLGYPLLRQWLVVISGAADGTALVLKVRNEGREEEAATITPSSTGSASVEIVTNATSELNLERSTDEPPEGSRLKQRWLVPIQMVELPARATMLVRAGTQIVCVAGGSVIAYDFASDTTWRLPLHGVRGILRDAVSMVAWGEDGAHAITGSIRRITDRPIHRAGHGAGGLVLESGESRFLVQQDRLVATALHPETQRVSALPFSVTLPNGLVAATHETKLAVALPWESN